MFHATLPFVGVGLLWGATNPLIKKGSVLVERQRGTGNASVLADWRALLTTPSFLVPQLLNQTGSVLFVWLLGGASISTAVPVANATSLAANAVADVLLGEKFKTVPLAFGLVLVFCGIMLCTI